jgi:SpoVK/Ycf46/Vps4 family AAA+-type ATPase
VRTLIAQVRAQQARAVAGIEATAAVENLVFTGPLVTAKTTVARLLARLYRALDLLPTDRVVEVDRSGLVSDVIGGTEKKTAEAIEKARGGVLFVDEAYAPVGEGNDFGGRAVDTILKAMEDQWNVAPQQQFIVIAAGYPDEMKSFLDSRRHSPQGSHGSRGRSRVLTCGRRVRATC